jgi:hypothetical protein
MGLLRGLYRRDEDGLVIGIRDLARRIERYDSGRGGFDGREHESQMGTAGPFAK